MEQCPSENRTRTATSALGRAPCKVCRSQVRNRTPKCGPKLQTAGCCLSHRRHVLCRAPATGAEVSSSARLHLGTWLLLSITEAPMLEICTGKKLSHSRKNFPPGRAKQL